MKILVPLDFSDCSMNALAFAEQLIVPLDVEELIIFHSCESQNEDHKNTLSKLSSEIVSRGTRCSYQIGEAKLHVALQNYLLDHDIDLIVIGSHGVSGKSEWFIGSNTQKVVRKLHCPILVIKEEIRSISFEKAAFVTSLAKSEQTCFEQFLTIIRKLGVRELHLLTINTSSFFSEPYVMVSRAQQSFEKIASDMDIKCHFYSDYSVEAGARHFIQELGIDIVGISNHNRNPIKRIIQGSNVELMVNHIDIPVLSIDY